MIHLARGIPPRAEPENTMHPRLTTTRKSPTVAEELAQVCPDYEAAERAAMRRASVVSTSAKRMRFTFEDGSALEFTHERYVVYIH